MIIPFVGVSEDFSKKCKQNSVTEREGLRLAMEAWQGIKGYALMAALAGERPIADPSLTPNVSVPKSGVDESQKMPSPSLLPPVKK